MIDKVPIKQDELHRCGRSMPILACCDADIHWAKACACARVSDEKDEKCVAFKKEIECSSLFFDLLLGAEIAEQNT